jgi:hypothetical protein
VFAPEPPCRRCYGWKRPAAACGTTLALFREDRGMSSEKRLAGRPVFPKQPHDPRARVGATDTFAGQPSGPTAAGVSSRAADRNNNADPTNSVTKNPFRARICPGVFHGEPNSKISAITAINA